MINTDSIPNELKALRQWVCWDANKVPINPLTGKNASSIDPSTWATFQFAHDLCMDDKRCKGVGFVFTQNDPYVGIDLDDCFESPASTLLKPEHAAVVDSLASYTELSPSGNGLHIIIKAHLKEASKRNGIEVYPHSRYFTMTGNMWGFNLDIEGRQAQVESLVRTLGGSVREQVESINIDGAIEEGMRNEWLFNQAATYFHSGKPIEVAEKVVRALNQTCTPPLPESEIRTLLHSAYRRENKAQAAARGITEQVRGLIESMEAAVFTSSEVVQELNIPPNQRETVRKVLHRMKLDGVIEAEGTRNGVWRKVDADLVPLDLLNAGTNYMPVRYPGGLHDLVNTMPGQVMIIAGDPDSGKSAYAMNLAAENVDDFTINYFSSEMGEVEMRSRIEPMDTDLMRHPNFRPYARCANFQDAVRGAPNVINIIDYLEVTEEFYKIGTFINQIFRKTGNALTVICVQKRTRHDEMPLGGLRALEKPRLVIAISRGWIKVVKGKNWTDPEKNPNGLVTRFKLVGGWKFIWDKRGWFTPPPKTKAAPAAPPNETEAPFTPIDDEPF